MSYSSGEIVFDTRMDASGFEKGANNLGNIVKGLGVFEIIKKGMQMVGQSIDAAVSRYDTLNRFPMIMEQMGYGANTAKASIQRLSDGIQGLPTTLDDIVSSTQQLTLATGDLDKGTDSALALNNAFMASGASAANASRGMTQYIQMLSSGKVDMMSWRTLDQLVVLVENLTRIIDKIDIKFEEISLKPPKKWENLSWLLIAGVVSGMLGYVISLFVGRG